MSYIGKAVQVQHRIATGHARLTNAGKGVRSHVPVPTELVTHDAVVLSEASVEGGEPKLTVIYKKDDLPLNSVELQSGFLALYDVPHKSAEGAEDAGLYWFVAFAETTEGKDAALQAIADEGAKQPEENSGEKPAPRLIKGSKAK